MSHALRLDDHLYPEKEHDDVARPRTRGDCADGVRPCPFVSCRHHLYLHLSRAGNIKRNFPDDVEPYQLTESCVLDVAERGEHTLESIAEHLNLTRERVRQIEVRALTKLRSMGASQILGLHHEEDPIAERRRLPVLYDDPGLEAFDVDHFTSAGSRRIVTTSGARVSRRRRDALVSGSSQ
jgi:hypothetical protein